jgi:hypothetical protein
MMERGKAWTLAKANGANINKKYSRLSMIILQALAREYGADMHF